MKLTTHHKDTDNSNVRLGSYIAGFVLSIVLTAAGFLLVWQHINGQHAFLTHKFIIGVIIVLAMVQLVVQLVFFLHLGREKKPRWNLGVLLFAILVVAILVVGSIWIMANLDYNMQLDRPDDSAIIEDEGFQPLHDKSATHDH